MSNYGSAPELSAQLATAAASPEAAIRALRALLDALGPALLLVDAGGRPLFVNRRAAQIVAQRDGLLIGPTGLATDSAKTTRSLRAAISAAASCADGGRASSPALRVTAARRPPHPPWLLSILPICAGNSSSPDDSLAGSAAGYAAISIVECEVRTRIDPSSVADYFLL